MAEGVNLPHIRLNRLNIQIKWKNIQIIPEGKGRWNEKERWLENEKLDQKWVKSIKNRIYIRGEFTSKNAFHFTNDDFPL